MVALVPDLASLVWLVHGPYGRNRYLLNLSFYGDESTGPGGTYVVAGLLAPAETWNCFWGAWDRALAEENIPMMHTAECVSGVGGIFGHLKDEPEKREVIQRRFIDLIADPKYGLVGIAAGIEMEPYTQLRDHLEKFRRPRPRSGIGGSLGEAYFLAFQAVLEIAADAAPGDERIGFVFDRNKTLKGRAVAIFDDLAAMPLSHTRRLGGIAFDDKARIKPLQAADVLAYEAYRRYSDHLAQRQHRWQWDALQPRVHQFVTFGFPDLVAVIYRHSTGGWPLWGVPGI